MFSVISLHKNATEKFEAKHIILYTNIISVYKKLINGKPVTHLEKSGFLNELRNIFRVSHPTDDLFRDLVDKIALVFNLFGATRAAELDI